MEIIFLDVKTGKPPVSPRQRLIRDAVEVGRVRFGLFRFRTDAAAAAIGVADEQITFTQKELTAELIAEEDLGEMLIIEPDPPEVSRFPCGPTGA